MLCLLTTLRRVSPLRSRRRSPVAGAWLRGGCRAGWTIPFDETEAVRVHTLSLREGSIVYTADAGDFGVIRQVRDFAFEVVPLS